MAEATLLTVTTVDGAQQEGELVVWNEEALTLRQEEESLTFEASRLLSVQWKNAPPSDSLQRTFLELIDGTQMPHQSYGVEGGEATISTSWSQQPLELSTDKIRYVQLTADISWKELKEQELIGDLLVVRKKKSGRFSFLTGIVGDISPEQVDFNWEGEKLTVKRSKIAALAYYHAREPAAKKFACWLNLHHGGRLPVTRLEFSGELLEVTTLNGLKFSLPVEAVRDADYSQGKLVYLSDLEPLSVQWTPRIDLPAAAKLIAQHGMPRRDQSFSGSVLSLLWPAANLGGADGELKNYSKGLALRSRTELRYRLPTGIRRFVALAGIDPETSSQGNVTLEIFAGRDSVWQGEIAGGSTPVPINIPLENARELRLLVDYGTNLDFGDRLHLIEARVSQ